MRHMYKVGQKVLGSNPDSYGGLKWMMRLHSYKQDRRVTMYAIVCTA